MQREQVLANGGLLEVHRGARQQVVVDFMFAAIAVIDVWSLNDKSGPEADIGCRCQI
jgi:hypothetical protein